MKRILAAGAALVSLTAALAAPESGPVLERGLEERVEVRLVLLDVVVLDPEDRTVPDLSKEAFAVTVDGKEVPVDTLDLSCPGGALEEPASTRIAGWDPGPDLAEGTRRVVLVFDYLHLRTIPCPDRADSWYCHHATRALEAMIAAVEKSDARDEEILVAALTGGLRIEQPFTRDREEVIRALRRMEYDVSLYAGNFGHLNDTPLFAGLESLFTLLREVPGPKAVVLVTAGAGPAVLPNHRAFERTAALASDARAAFYPVDVMGLYARAPT